MARACEYGVPHSAVMPEGGLFDARAITTEHDHLARVCADAGFGRADVHRYRVPLMD